MPPFPLSTIPSGPKIQERMWNRSGRSHCKHRNKNWRGSPHYKHQKQTPKIITRNLRLSRKLLDCEVIFTHLIYPLNMCHVSCYVGSQKPKRLSGTNEGGMRITSVIRRHVVSGTEIFIDQRSPQVGSLYGSIYSGRSNVLLQYLKNP
jgi:hypothetical protein